MSGFVLKCGFAVAAAMAFFAFKMNAFTSDETVEQNMRACDSMAVQTRVAGCTALLARKGLSTEHRALAYLKRSGAYYALNDTDHAIADLEAASALTPHDYMPFHELAIGYRDKARPSVPLKRWTAPSPSTEIRRELLPPRRDETRTQPVRRGGSRLRNGDRSCSDETISRSSRTVRSTGDQEPSQGQQLKELAKTYICASGGQGPRDPRPCRQRFPERRDVLCAARDLLPASRCERASADLTRRSRSIRSRSGLDPTRTWPS